MKSNGGEIEDLRLYLFIFNFNKHDGRRKVWLFDEIMGQGIISC